jgi:hypothetical protein
LQIKVIERWLLYNNITSKNFDIKEGFFEAIKFSMVIFPRSDIRYEMVE